MFHTRTICELKPNCIQKIASNLIDRNIEFMLECIDDEWDFVVNDIYKDYLDSLIEFSCN